MSDFENFVTSLVKQEYDKRELPATATTTTGQPATQAAPPIVLNIDGREVRYDNVESLNRDILGLREVVKGLNEKVNTNDYIATSGPAPYTEPAPKVDDDFDATFLFKAMEHNPKRAFEYGIEKATGVKPSEIKSRLDRAEQSEKVLEAYRFKEMHPDFPGGNAAVVVDRIRESMNLPFNAQSLEAAYSIAKERGFVQPLRYNPPQAAAPPPVPRGGGDVSPQIRQMAEDMTADQLEATIRKIEAGQITLPR